ncbi:AbrB/MazE/SpoVT family DNA-binding domain-containing protein [Aureibacillus halotolerans]|uniref:AbrB family transcriptional regulator n=1 Tax=Aureibacillus halotolerans TaxID=1508390 RepID=A0A4R6TWX3_9BACI|nr:AbrB/MazE/SpoVT family DNA-binding domain-containing protein [Aureibacillus halotolerans]TDQ33448.1 AbrB family transcriptional regulator [Aureibacillus halotolerans]
MEREELTLKKTITLRSKNQLTIPNDVVEKLNLHQGDAFEVSVENGRVVLIPVVTIEKDQAWFWTKDWQVNEEQAQIDIENGNVKKFSSTDALFSDLDDENDEDD